MTAKGHRSDKLLSRYTGWLKRSKSEKTTDLYTQRARAFLEWAGDRDLTGQLLDDYITDLTEEGKSKNTLATYYNGLRSFYRFMGKAEELAEIQAPRFEEAEIRCPTKDDVDRMLEAATLDRDRALLALHFGAGLRVGELRALDRKDLVIHPDGSGEIIVRSEKTRNQIHDVRIPIGASVVTELSTYLNNREDDLEPLFPSEKASEGRITTMTINNTYKRLCRVAGIDPPITSHQLRHALTTWLLQQGVSRDDVRKICRWKSERSMSRYDHLVPTDIRSRIPDPFDGGEDDGPHEPDNGEHA